jgi:probable 2-oxoglutarate dehydrogenase E1 component DHKTD1
VHPRIKKFFIDDRVEQVKKNEFDWPTGEAMAVGSLLEQGFNVRLSG